MKEALKALVHEMEYVLSCINADKVPFDGDDFHEALRLGKEALAQPEQEPTNLERHERNVQKFLGTQQPKEPEQEPDEVDIRSRLYQRIHELETQLAQPEQEPFGYFKAEPFGWTDCAETDNGAIALYDRPQRKEPEQEPVAWMYPDALCDKACLYLCTKGFTQFPECANTPPQRTWVGLTDEEMWGAYTGGSDIINLDYAKAIEAKLKEKNT